MDNYAPQSFIWQLIPLYAQGQIAQVKCYVRGEHQLPITGIYGVIFRVLNRASEMDRIVQLLKEAFSVSVPPQHIHLAMDQAIQCLEVMVSEGWVKAQVNRQKTKLQISIPNEGKLIHTHHE